MSEKLLEYNKKRSFDKTLEPEGRDESSEGVLKFVVQHHMASREHYDFRLEWGGALLSWAVPKGPSYNPKDKRLCIKVEDHPLEYRNFEGTIPKGEYGGGTVMLWDEGTWEPLADVDKGLEEGSLKFILNGRRLKGKWALVRIKGKEKESKDNWLLIKEKDEYLKEDDGISEFNTSIRTDRTMEEIETGEDEKYTKNPFDYADVQLAKMSTSIPEGEEWLFELKYDGYRILAFIEGNGARLMSRNNINLTHRFESIASSLLDLAQGRAMVLDGEIAVIDDTGKTDFQALQNYMKNPKPQNLVYIVFDILALDGQDLRGLKLIKRKEILKDLLSNPPGNLHYSQHVAGNGKECFKAACSLGMEGIVGKRADSVYSGTRNGDWIKVKCEKRQEFVIGGYTVTDKSQRGLSALLLGAYEGGKLKYTGRAGTGFTQRSASELLQELKPLATEDSPFENPPNPASNEKITWVKPELVAEIRFAELTKDNLLRQASFKGLRTDKNPKEVVMEGSYTKLAEPPETPVEPAEAPQKGSIVIKGIKISNPDKVMFENPKITKGDMVRYYEQVSLRMLPYVGGRILSVVRCPKGVAQACFFKKHPGSDSKGIAKKEVINSEGEAEEYFYIENEYGIISEAQMGTLEFHIWGSRVDNIDKPDMLVFDLDPDEGMDICIVRQGVRDIKSILDELSLTSFLKTSGGKGYHVVVPLIPSVSWDVFYDFARRVAEVMESKWPDRYTSNVRKARRTNKIFIDWMRNGKGATSVAPYSLRARDGAKVSMPISWDELDSVTPDGIDMKEALARIKDNDPWKGFFDTKQQLK